MMAVELSATLGWISSSDVARIEAIFRLARLPVVGAPLPVDRYLDLMSHDKKVEDGRLRLVLLQSVGKAVVSDQASEVQIRSAIQRRLPHG